MNSPQKDMQKDMQLLFLDIDGVLNDLAFAHWVNYVAPKGPKYHHINPMLAANVAMVLQQCPAVRIVISSSWRQNRTLEELNTMLSDFGIPSEKIIGMTPRKPDNPRGERILEWLVDNKCPDNFFLILDDDEDMSYLWPHHILTDADLGFTAPQAVQVAEHFQNQTLPYMALAADRESYWEARGMLDQKMDFDESAAWLSRSRSHPEIFGDLSPVNWVKAQIERVRSIPTTNKGAMEFAAKAAWEKVKDVIRKIP
jgi:hypothetical protein